MVEIGAQKGVTRGAWSDDLLAACVDTMELVLFSLLVVSNLVMAHTPVSDVDLNREKVLGGMLWVLLAVTWHVLRKSYSAAVWLLVGGLSSITILLVHWYPSSGTGALLALPVIVAVAFLGEWQGLGVGLVVSMALRWQLQRVFAGPIRSDALVALGSVWGSALLTWSALRPLRSLSEWSWRHYDRAQALLEEARERQAELHEVKEDLERANRNLARLNQVVTASQKEAELARQAKENFVANVSHELRTPLNMIIGFSDMISRAPRVYRKGLPRELLADVTAIRRNAKHLSELVDDVLDLSKADSGYMTLSMEPCHPRDLTTDAAQAVGALFVSKKLSMAVDIPEDLPQVYCDVTRIRQVLLNLLSNAGRFTERGGVRVAAMRREGELVISVADTGPGIPAEDIPRLFEPFRQLEMPSRDQSGGTGLGLSICKRLVELHGGRMWAESEVGVGTTFSFSLPIQSPAQAGTPVHRWLGGEWHHRALARPRRVRPAQAEPLVVLVDREAALAPLLARHLDGCEVIVARDSGELMSTLQESPARAVIINEATVEQERSWEEILATLPYSLPVLRCRVAGSESTAARLGAFESLMKPVSREELLDAVERVPDSVETILIVDDESECVQLFARMLESGGSGYGLLRANNGKRALEIVRTARPDLVLLDLMMPEMDGFELLSRMHADPGLSKVPIITVSALDLSKEELISESLKLSRPEGLSQRDLLDGVKALVQVIGPTWHTVGQGLAGKSDG